MIFPIQQFLRDFWNNNEDILQGLIRFLENAKKKFVVVESGFQFVKPKQYFELVCIKEKGKRKMSISCCKVGDEAMYVIYA
jgi:hypothetical protein